MGSSYASDNLQQRNGATKTKKKEGDVIDSGLNPIGTIRMGRSNVKGMRKSTYKIKKTNKIESHSLEDKGIGFRTKEKVEQSSTT